MRLRTIGKRWALVLAVVAVTLVSAQVAGAQQPPTANQPPAGAPPAGQGADLSIELGEAEHGGSEIEEGERVSYEAHIVNHGPGIARGVRVIVSTSEDFDLDEVNQEAECQTNPGEEGRMVCSYGDLAAGAELRLKFRGAFRDDDGRTRTNVYVEGLSPDPDPTNNRGRQGSRVHENEPDRLAGLPGGDPSDLGPSDLCENPTIVGTDGDDVIVGTSGDDVIVGLGGEDRIDGGEGDDVICGGAGNDGIEAGDGDDVVSGGGGEDLLFGDSFVAGADVLMGDDGNDLLVGGGGNDRIEGGDGDDFIVGEAGDDELSGGDGNDELSGSDGDDDVDGGAGADDLFGGSGNDELFGGSGNDELDAQDGEADTLIDGGADIDACLFDAGIDPVPTNCP